MKHTTQTAYHERLSALIDRFADEIRETNDAREAEGLGSMGAVDWLEFFQPMALEQARYEEEPLSDDTRSKFTNWCRVADRSEAEMRQELDLIDTNVDRLSAAGCEELEQIWRTTDVVPELDANQSLRG